MGKRLIISIVLALVLGLVGWLAGALIGGNYLEAFRFAGLRGYEAAGQVGAILGAGMGVLLGWIFTKMK